MLGYTDTRRHQSGIERKTWSPWPHASARWTQCTIRETIKQVNLICVLKYCDLQDARGEVASLARDSGERGSLARVLEKGSLVEECAVEGLGRIGGPEAIAALEAAQDRPDVEVRAAVRRVLGMPQGQIRSVEP
jgi:hypothetical protein